MALDKIGRNDGNMIGGLTTVSGQVENAFNFDGEFHQILSIPGKHKRRLVHVTLHPNRQTGS